MKQMSVTLIVLLMMGFVLSSNIYGSNEQEKPVSTADEEIDIVNMSLDELLNVEVNVATKTSSTIDDTPGIVTVIDRRMIELTNAKTLVDIVRMVPGFDFSRASLGWGESLDEFYARGIVNIFSQTILFLVNGRNKLNDLVYASPYMSSRVNVEMIERVEIIRGPGSALYGGNAFSAVINIITRDTGTEPETIFELKGGQYNSGSVYGLVRTRIGKRGWKIGIQGKYFYEGGTSHDFITDAVNGLIRDGLYSPTMAEYSNKVTDGINPSYDLSMNVASPDDKLRFQIWHTNHKPHPILSDFRPQINADTYLYKVTQTFFNMEYQLSPDFSIAGHHSIMTWDGRLNYSTQSYDLDDGLEETLQLNTHSQVDLSYNKTIKNHNILVGVSVSREEQKDPSELLYKRPSMDLNTLAIYYDPAVRNQFSAFIQDNWKITNKLAVTAGLRYDNYDDLENGSIVNPRAALVWNAFGKSRFKILYGQAFRPPAGFEVGGTLGATTGTSDLKPEKISTGELAYIHYFDFARMQISLYYSKVNDPIDEKDGKIVNIGERTAIGGEVELQGKYWWINYSYTDSKRKDSEGNEFTTHFLSPHMLNMGVHYTFFDKLTVRNQLFFRSERPAIVEGQDDAPAHFVDDLSFALKLKNVEFILGIRNLFDTQWECPLQFTHDTAIKAYPYRGREISLKAVVRIR